MFVLLTYSQLTDDCLSATTASCPLIESLILMSCPSIGLCGLCSLQLLPNLTLLDLSYTFLVNLQPVFESCSQLKVRFSIHFHVHIFTFMAAGNILLNSSHPHPNIKRKFLGVVVMWSKPSADLVCFYQYLMKLRY